YSIKMASNKQPEVKHMGYWYFGGVASAMAAACTHPLDLLKVHLQTQQKADIGLVRMGVVVLKRDGIMGLYNGLSASIMRQLTYSMTRFAIYETYKSRKGQAKMSFAESAGVALIGGFVGGVVGNPADMVNVRMQNDVKLPLDQRRNYRHVFDGLYQVCRNEGAVKVMNGVSMTSTRAALVTFGQLAFYDLFKGALMSTGLFGDDPLTHFTASFGAGGTATLVTQPFDVMKTRLMNAKPGAYTGLSACAADIYASGFLFFGFFKGIVPAFVRLAPHTVLTFVFLEQLKANFGYTVTVAKAA
ncbi:hypothetical protein BOX15_Mlig022545g1, partial [Macrostomum lignano]